MREFRVWDRVMGFYQHEIDFTVTYWGGLFSLDDECYHAVEPDRYDVEYATGLKDKNGKKIYEGDIVQKPSPAGDLELTGVVEFYSGNDKAEYGIQWYEDGDKPWWGRYFDGLEITGNIHENPELLED
jgi:uncharacterized phage protein (TIGR01671 family)